MNRNLIGNKFLINGSANYDSNRHIFRKCAYNCHSYGYADNVRKHDEIMELSGELLHTVDMTSVIDIKIAFHFLAPRGSYSRTRVLSRVHDVIVSLNDDFNNYSPNSNTMNNFRYKSIVNQVFIDNMSKQSIYLGPEYLQFVPLCPSNIIFNFGEIYYYPITAPLRLTQFNDLTEIELEYQAIKQYIHANRADAIDPERVLNIWIIDMIDTSILGFSSFPWEPIDSYNGIVINRRVFFPEDYHECAYPCFKTFTHHVGHYLGLLHSIGDVCNLETSVPANLHLGLDSTKFCCFTPTYDPTDITTNRQLLLDLSYNPLFMNFMDFTYDKYVAIFTLCQIKKMRMMICLYRPCINSACTCVSLPLPLFNPDNIPVTTVTLPINECPNSCDTPVCCPCPTVITHQTCQQSLAVQYINQQSVLNTNQPETTNTAPILVGQFNRPFINVERTEVCIPPKIHRNQPELNSVCGNFVCCPSGEGDCHNFVHWDDGHDDSNDCNDHCQRHEPDFHSRPILHEASLHEMDILPDTESDCEICPDQPILSAVTIPDCMTPVKVETPVPVLSTHVGQILATNANVRPAIRYHCGGICPIVSQTQTLTQAQTLAQSQAQTATQTKIRTTPIINNVAGPQIYNQYGQRIGQNNQRSTPVPISGVPCNRNRFIRTKPINFR